MRNHVNKQLMLRGIAPIGRDRFFEVMRVHGLLVRRRRSTRTTNSYHRFRTHKNLLKTMVVSGPDQAWVSDITYLELGKGFCYLFLITDYYSRKIVGYYLSRSLAAQGALRALQYAIKHSKGKTQGLVHHSDRGIQYCCDAYAGMLAKHGLVVSMTEENHCYENAVAERVNGILKHDLMLSAGFQTMGQAKREVSQAVKIYNNERWHQSLHYMTPAQKYAA